MADWVKYRTLQVNLEKQVGHVVEFDSAIGDPKTQGRIQVPLVTYLNYDDVGPSGWEVCGVVPSISYATIILMRREHS